MLPPTNVLSIQNNGRMEHTNLRLLLIQLTDELKPHSDTPYLDAQVLLAHSTGTSRAWVLAHPEHNLDLAEREILIRELERLKAGEPLPYVLGHWEFYGLNFKITPKVLIPRPETETLVELALEWLRQYPDKRTAVDVGTGSGCIAIALAVNIPDLRVIATDISTAALRVAKENARKHGVSDRIEFACADLLNPFAYGPVQQEEKLNPDLICANLPYLPTRRLQSSGVFGREPTLALDGGPEGLSIVYAMMIAAHHHLAKDACAILEIDAYHGKNAFELAKKTFPQADISLLTDLSGRDRLITIHTG